MTDEEQRRVDAVCTAALDKIEKFKAEIVILKRRLEIANDIGIRAQKLNRFYQEKFENKGVLQ